MIDICIYVFYKSKYVVDVIIILMAIIIEKVIRAGSY